MKSIFNISIFILLSVTIQAQRDTLDYNTTVDTATATIEFVDPDTILNFSYTIDDLDVMEINRVHKEFVIRDSLDSILNLINLEINAQTIWVEHHYKSYQQSNSLLWNLQKQYAKIEEAYNALYNP